MNMSRDKFTQSLRWRFLSPLILVSLLCILVSMVFFYRQAMSQLRHEAEQRGKGIVNSISYAAQVVRDSAGLQRFVSSLGAEPGVEMIVVVAGSPPVVVASTHNEFRGEKLSDLPDEEYISQDLQQALETQELKITFWHGPNNLIDFSAPMLIHNADRSDGKLAESAVMLHLEGEPIMAAVTMLAITWGSFLACVILVLSGLIYLKLSRLVITPSSEIVSVIRRRAQGEHNLFVQFRANDEIGEIGSNLNNLFSALVDSTREINDIKTALDQHAIVSIADLRGKITYVNDKFCSISRYSRDELMGQDHRIVNSGHHPKEFMRELWRTIANGEVWHGEVKNRAKDGSEYWVASSIVPFLDEKGRPTQYVSIRTDITEQKSSELKHQTLVLELDRSNKELADFAYVVSHDLKAPLRGVNSIATWIVTDYADKLDDDGREQLKLMTNRIERMHGLIEGILQFSRVGREKLDTPAVDLQEAVQSLFEFLSIPKGITASIDTQLPTILFEQVRIRQVFQNLLSNAVKYMGKPTGEIHVGYRESGSEIQFYVRDTGPGIEEKYFNKIFQLFQTLHARDEYESTGVGLALIKKIIEAKGGRVWVESVVGQGSTFWVSLPKCLLVRSDSQANTQGLELKVTGEAAI